MRILHPASVLLFLAGPALAQFEGVLQMKTTADRFTGTTTSWVSKVGVKTEMDMKSPDMEKQGMGSGMKMVTIVRHAEPDVVYTLNVSSKTWSLIDTKEMREQARSGREEATYTVKRTGKDSVAGFPCEKALVTSSRGTISDVCIANDVAGGSALLRAMHRRSGDESALFKAFADAGLTGFPVRWVTKSESGRTDVTMELVSAKKESVPASTFEIPAGYTRSDSAMPMSNPELDKKMREALEKMTPEQRKQFEEMMKRRSEGR